MTWDSKLQVHKWDGDQVVGVRNNESFNCIGCGNLVTKCCITEEATNDEIECSCGQVYTGVVRLVEHTYKVKGD